VASRAERAADGKGKRDMEPKINRDCDFTQVERTFTAYPCTPVLGPEHENVIRINAPEEVTFVAHGDDPLGEDTRFVICGALQMRTDTLDQLGIHGDELDKIMLVAVDAKSNKTTAARSDTWAREPMPDDLKKPSPPGYRSAKRSTSTWCAPSTCRRSRPTTSCTRCWACSSPTCSFGCAAPNEPGRDAAPPPRPDRRGSAPPPCRRISPRRGHRSEPRAPARRAGADRRTVPPAG
jgi:hypothetical protein